MAAVSTRASTSRPPPRGGAGRRRRRRAAAAVLGRQLLDAGFLLIACGVSYAGARAGGRLAYCWGSEPEEPSHPAPARRICKISAIGLLCKKVQTARRNGQPALARQ